MKLSDVNADLLSALQTIANAETGDIAEPYDEWGEASLLHHVQNLAKAAIAKAESPPVERK